MTSSWSKGLANAVGAGLMALGVATSAHADGVAAPGVAYEQPFNWTGLYIGANAGWVDSAIGWVYHDPTGGAADRPLCGGVGCDITQTSGIYGVHAGYQYQFGSLVLGLEFSLSKPASNGGSKPCFNAAVTCSAETDYLATLGPRLGWAVSNWMVYGTGGYAHAQISTHETGGTFATRLGHDGWFAGVGGEYAPDPQHDIGHRISARRARYRFALLDHRYRASQHLCGLRHRSGEAFVEVRQRTASSPPAQVAMLSPGNHAAN